MSRRFLLLALGALLLAGAVFFAYSEYDREVAATATRPVKQSVTAIQLLADFQADEVAATQRYVGAAEQVVQVVGTIRSIERVDTAITNVLLETADELAGVVCEFPNNDLPTTWGVGHEVRVNGICTGMLMDVVLVRCIAAP